jgi:hypothetical protein
MLNTAIGTAIQTVLMVRGRWISETLLSHSAFCLLALGNAAMRH